MSPLSAAISGGLAIAGDSLGASSARDYSSKQAKRARAHDIYMANNRYQFAAKDLEKAGLNRVLALGSPAGSSGSPSPQAQPVAFGSKGIQAASAKSAIELQDMQKGLLAAQTRKTGAEADLAEFTKGLAADAQPYLDSMIDRIKEGIGTNARDLTPQSLGQKAQDVVVDTAKGLVQQGQKNREALIDYGVDRAKSGWKSLKSKFKSWSKKAKNWAENR